MDGNARYRPANDNDRIYQLRLAHLSRATNTVVEVATLSRPQGRARVYLIERSAPSRDHRETG
jgi:hypothetical protein